jgi:Rod binding domain-containing protein
MEITPFQRHIKATQLPLEKLAGNSNLTQAEKLGEISRQFEAVLLRQILSEAQKPVFQSKAAGSSVSGDVYRDLVTTQLADQISRSGSIGLARGLESQLQHQLKPGQKPEATEPPATSGTRSVKCTTKQ